MTGRSEFDYYDVADVKRRLPLEPGQLAFTCCQVPVVYRLAQKNSLTVVLANGTKRHAEPLRLDASTSREIF